MAEIVDDPHTLQPRATPFLIGHEAAQKTFGEALAAKRLHHAWLLSGPKGIGKATLAYHLARKLLAEGEGGAALFARVASGAEGNLRVVERSANEKTGVLRSEIVVDDIRALHSFFEMTAAREGWRVAIIDSADEMNRNAANALLKMLEEPPARSVLLLVSHAKGRLLPTIRSRCHAVTLDPLTPVQVRQVLDKLFPELPPAEAEPLAALANGAPGFAARLAANEGLKLKALADGLLEGKPMGAGAMHELATALSARANEEGYFLFVELLTRGIGAKIRALGEAGAPAARLDCWLALWDNVNRLVGEGEGLNLSRKQILLLILEDAAAVTASAAA
jgi:DNA polymerase III subunit delta'